MQPFRSFLFLVAAGLLVGCSYVPQLVTEYRIDVQQGNVLTQEMVSQLKPGQTRDQVRFILGTPLLQDPFHARRWDYIYRFQNGRTNAVESRQLAVFFGQDGLLERVSGAVEVAQVSDLTIPVAKTQVIDLGTLPADGSGAALPPVEDKGFFGSLLERVGF